MSASSPSTTTTFVSRGRLSGVVRERTFDEALYYRARLILGDSLPRPISPPFRRSAGRPGPRGSSSSA
jgi:hypothetical protein